MAKRRCGLKQRPTETHEVGIISRFQMEFYRNSIGVRFLQDYLTITDTVLILPSWRRVFTAVWLTALSRFVATGTSCRSCLWAAYFRTDY